MVEPLENASNSELLSYLAGEQPAQTLMEEHGNLTNLARVSFHDLRRVKGVGESRAAAIKSAFLLARRLSREVVAEAPLLDTPERIADLLREEFRGMETETFQVVLLNTRRRLIRVHLVSTGTLNEVHVHAREVFRPAITLNASAVVAVHNHPSGDPQPSDADIRVTRDLIRAGQLLRIEMLDHIILGRATPERPQDHVSLRELGFFYD